jgi:hypothetical protein
MSWDAVREFETVCAEGVAPEPPLEWLLAKLRQAIEELMEAEVEQPLQKANGIARLGGLYLKALGAAELTKANKALKQRVAALEEELQQVRGSAVADGSAAPACTAQAAARSRPPEAVAAAASSTADGAGAPATRAARTPRALPADRSPGKRPSVGSRKPKSGRRTGPRRP